MPFKPEEMMVKPILVAQDIISVLNCRKGFDYWWYNIDEAIQEEIIEKIAKRISVYYNQYP